jgi:RNase P/RNase MRP subunit p29
VLGASFAAYARAALPDDLTEQRQRKLVGLSLNLTGCSVRVSRSACANYVGLEGIVVCLTARMLQIVTPNDATRWLPRDGTVLRIEVAGRSWEVSRPPVKSIA